MAERGPILVVDDEPEIVQFVSGVLEDEGFDLMTAADGREAVDKAAEHRPALVVLDLMLPRLDGVGVAAELHERYGENLPILMISADHNGRRKAQQAGAFAYLSKPFDLNHLVELVHRGLVSA